MEFKPSPKMNTIYWLYSLPYFIVVGVISGVIGFFNTLAGMVIALVFAVPVLILLVIWIPRFYARASFRLEKDHAYARFGVWWVKEKRVPYNLVSEVRLRQGPLQRMLGLANVDVFTPATGVMKPEITYFQLDAGKANEIAMELRRRAGILTERERRVIEEEILSELRRIRSLMEEFVKRSSSQ